MVGVLALQGGFAAHLTALAEAGVEGRAVRTAEALDEIDGLVLPGGESTVQRELIERLALRPALERCRARGIPILGTCAGIILMSHFGWLDITVERNAYGPQIHSFEAVSDDGAWPLVFIRAPQITRVGSDVEVRARHAGKPVWVAQDQRWGATFHPELCVDNRSSMVRKWLGNSM